MMGMEVSETCWATHKRQVINLWNCCIWLVNLFELYDDARTCQRQIQPLLVALVGPSSHIWATSTLQDARHHRHWQRVLGQVGGLHLSTLCFPLPLSGTVLGGTMELHGNNISLACFHGINFKSKSWALFSLKEPCISFATEAQEVPSPECKCGELK